MSVFTANLLFITENAKENGRKMRKKMSLGIFPRLFRGKPYPRSKNRPIFAPELRNKSINNFKIDRL